MNDNRGKLVNIFNSLKFHSISKISISPNVEKNACIYHYLIKAENMQLGNIPFYTPKKQSL